VSIPQKARRWIAGGAAVAAIAGGSGLALAQGGAPPPATPIPTAAAGTTVDTPEPGDVPDRVDGTEAPGSERADDASRGAEKPGAEQADDASEAADAAKLLKTAKVSRAEAVNAALATTPGTVTEAQIGDEDGTVVWEIGVRTAGDGGHEVKVDASTGAVISSAVDPID